MLNATGTLFIADKNHNWIQKLALSTGMITKAAGTVDGSSGSNTYELQQPEAIALGSLDKLNVSDTQNNRIQFTEWNEYFNKCHLRYTKWYCHWHIF